MATPPENDDANHSNAPLNFRHSNTLITTKVPHYPTKLTTGMSIIPGWNRPNANGQNSNINDKDYNGPNFKARPLKHWRKQLQVYNYNGPANNSRTATISELERPGTTVYHFTPDCTCVPDEGGNSYIISNNKFGYEVKDDNYSKGVLDVKVQNNGFTLVPYDATTAQINDPTNQSAYKIMTGIHNTNCINCSPQGNLIRSGIAFQSQAFFSYSNDKLETRCQTYEQNISTNKEPGCVYFDAQGIPLWPNDARNGPQVVAPVNYQPIRLFNKPCLSETIYKPNNIGFAKQGAVSGSTRLKKLVSDTTTLNGSSFYSARGAEEANLGRFQGTNLSSNYYVKNKPVVDSCRGSIPTPPVLSIVDRDTYSITFTWQDFGNSFCNVVYYTVTYFAINIIERLRNVDDSHDFFNSSEGDIDIQDFLDNYNELQFYSGNNTNNNSYENTGDSMGMGDSMDTGDSMAMGMGMSTDMVIWNKNGIVGDNTIYTDRENNIRYTITSQIRTKNVARNTVNTVPNRSNITELNPNTYYLMSMTSTTGNGTSIRSNAVLGSTLLYSNIVINIEPFIEDYIYPYSSTIPISLTIRVSSDHKTTPIILRIINISNSDVAKITPIQDYPDTYEVQLMNVGTFNLQGEQARGLGEFSNIGNSITISPLLTISKGTPEVNEPWKVVRNNVLIVGKTYSFYPLTFLSDIVQFYGEYKIIDIYGRESNIATFINNDGVESNTSNFIDNFRENSNKILVKSSGIFRIKATTVETQNYRSISVISGNIYATRDDPIIEFEFPDAESFNRRFTYRTGQTYDIAEINQAKFIHPAPNVQPPDLYITYSAISVETDTTSDVVDIVTRTVTIMNAGSFKIRARTNQTNVYNSIYIDSPPITINKATPTFSEPWYLFQDIDSLLLKGRTYSFSPPSFTFPYPGPSFPSEFVSITSYTSSSTTVTLIGSTTTIRIDEEGPFTITAQTTESRNYNRASVTSQEEIPTLNTARVAFPGNFKTSITYGEEYFLNEAYFIYPSDVYNFEGVASLSGSRIVVSEEQYNYFIINRRITADIVNSVPGSSPPLISSSGDIIINKKIEYDTSNRVSRHVIYIRNDTGIPESTPVTITNIIQYVSELRDFFITYTIVSPTGSTSDVATISGTSVTLLKAGTFKIRAHTNQISPAPAPTIFNSTRDSPLITVNKATPILQLNDLFEYTLQVKNTYSFNKATISKPVIIPNEILPITYVSLNPDIVTVVISQPTASQRPSILINRVGSFKIRAETKPSERYNIGYVESPEEFSTNPGMPVIKFDPSQDFGPFTYRTNPSFEIKEVIFINPPPPPPAEINVLYNIPETIYVSKEERTVTINNVGQFMLTAKTIQSENFNVSNIIYRHINIKRFTPQFYEGWRAFINNRNVNYVFVGQTFQINPPILINPEPDQQPFPSEILSIQYSIVPDKRAEIFSISETSTVVKVLQEGPFTIIAQTTEDRNHNIGETISVRIYGSVPERPIIEFPGNNEVNEITYGDDYFLEEAVFTYPERIITIEGTATLSITSNETRIVLNSLEQYNRIVIQAYLRVTITSTSTLNFIVESRSIQNGQFIVVVTLSSILGEILSIGNYTIENMTQEIIIPVGGSIAYSIVPPPQPIPPSYVKFGPVAEISGTNVTIKRTGSFTVQAIATIINDPPTFRHSSYPVFSTVNVKRATPTLLFDNDDLFPNQVLITNRRYSFRPATVMIPSSVTPEVISVEYTCVPLGVVTIFPLDVSSNTIPIRVNRAEQFRIKAQTFEPPSGNFNRSIPIFSKYEKGAQENRPVLFFPGADESGVVPVTNLTYGENNNIYNVEQLADFSYPEQNNIPVDLTINYRINEESSNIARVEMRNTIVEHELLGTITINIPVITIFRAGSFKLIAETNAGKFRLDGYTEPTVQLARSEPVYREFNVQRATPTFQTWNIFNSEVFTGTTVEFYAPLFLTPSPVPSEILPFTYESFTSSDDRIITIEPQQRIDENGVTVFTARIHRKGPVSITAKTLQSDNYNRGVIPLDSEISIIHNTPVIYFPGDNRSPDEPSQPESDFITQITYGETYTLRQAFFDRPSVADITRFGLRITYRIVDASDNTLISNVASINGTTVTIHRAGTFTIVAETNNTYAFQRTSINRNVTVLQATPTISFNPTFTDISNPTLGNIETFFVNNQYTFSPATVTQPSTVPRDELTITYSSGNGNAEVDGTARTIRIINDGPIVIVASTGVTNNFLPGTATYNSVRITRANTPGIIIPSIVGISGNQITLGRDYTLQASTFYHPSTADVIRFGLSIQHRIVDAVANTVTTNVATINGTTITLITSGSFRIRAETVEQPPSGGQSIFIRREVFSPVINVIRVTPGIAFPNNDLFRNIDLLVNGVYNFTPAVVTIPAGIRNEALTVEYTSEPAGVVTILLNPLRIQVNRQGRFQIRARIVETNNFNSNFILSDPEYGVQLNTPVLEFPGLSFTPDALGNIINFTDTFTFGTINPNTTINPNRNINIYTPTPAVFNYPQPANIPSLGLTITYSIPTTNPNIATLEMRNVTVNSVQTQIPVITISRVGGGSFTLIATTNETTAYRSVSMSIIVTVIRGTPTFNTWTPFSILTTPLVTGTIVNFRIPQFLTPNPVPTEIPAFTVSSFTILTVQPPPLPLSSDTTTAVATILSGPVIVNGVTVFSIRINRLGGFYIRAETVASENYNRGQVTSLRVTVNTLNTPRLKFPTNPAPIRAITYGETYTVSPAYFDYPIPSLVRDFNLIVTHSIRNSSYFTLSLPGPSPNFTQTVNISRAGTFTIYAESTPILNSFNAATPITLGVTVNRARPTITFPTNIFPELSGVTSEQILIVNTSYNFLPAVISAPGISDASRLPEIRYRTNDANIATIDPNPVTTPQGIRRRINIIAVSRVPIIIIAYTQNATNFIDASANYTNTRSVYFNTPEITAPLINNNINNILTFGQQTQPTFQLSVVTNPSSVSPFHRSISDNIQYAIVDASYNNTLRNDVATISGTTITLHTSGRFRIRATTVNTSIFRSISRWSNVVTVNRGRPTLPTSWNPIPTVLFVGDTAVITPPVFTFPITPNLNEIPPTYSYISNTKRIVTINQPNPLNIRINSTGSFRIRATTRESTRYESVYIDSPMGFNNYNSTTRRIPVLVFPANFQTQVTFGTPYTLREAFFSIPAGTPPPPDPAANGVTIQYSIVNPSAPNVATSTGDRGTTITILNRGHFYIRAETNNSRSTLFDNAVPIPSLRVTVVPATPTFPSTVWDGLPSGVTTFFVGDTVTITPPPQLTFPSVALQQAHGIHIVYIVGGVEITGTTFTRAFAGTFDIRAETRSNGNYTTAQIRSSRIPTFINRPPPRIIMHNVETLTFQEASIPESPTFIEQSPRGFPEWFAVVDQRSYTDIRNYAITRAQGGLGTAVFMRIPGNNSTLIPFNNIVTTLMTNMAFLFNGIVNFNEVIASWDTSRVTDMNSMFFGCSNFNQRVERWNTGRVETMNRMFSHARLFSQNLGFWNTQSVRNMNSMFEGATAFNNGGFQGIGNWNVSNVLSMQFMFSNATSFNMPINWDTRQLRNMDGMFNVASNFHGSLSLSTNSLTSMNAMFNSARSFLGHGNIWQWNTRNVVAMNGVFMGAISFNANLNWITDSVNDMAHMFDGCMSFNGDVSLFNTSRVQQMRFMFRGCIFFDRPIRSNGHSWQVGNVLNMTGMFDGATNFNQNIRYWNTNSVTDMSFMFRNAQRFNQPIDLWNTSNVTDMQSMFQGARSFNQNINTTPTLGGWNTSRVTNMERMFEGATDFNNGQWPPIFGFNGYLNLVEMQQNFVRAWISDNGNVQAEFLVNSQFFMRASPRQTMNWNTAQVRNMNFMFHNATNFINVDLRRWPIVNHSPVGFRRNCPLLNEFAPFAVFLRADRGR